MISSRAQIKHKTYHFAVTIAVTKSLFLIIIIICFITGLINLINNLLSFQGAFMIKSYKLTLTGLLVLCFGLHAMEKSENFESTPTKVVTHNKQVKNHFIPTSKSWWFEKYIRDGHASNFIPTSKHGRFEKYIRDGHASNFIPTSKRGRFEKYINGGRVSKNRYYRK